MEPPFWNIITPSQYEWERRGLDFIRAGLPNHDPYRAWSNFEFQTAHGANYEVDLLVLTKRRRPMHGEPAEGGYSRVDSEATRERVVPLAPASPVGANRSRADNAVSSLNPSRTGLGTRFSWRCLVTMAG